MIFFFALLCLQSAKSQIYLYVSDIDSDPLISIDEKVENSLEIAKQIYLHNFSVSLTQINSKYVISDSSTPPEGYSGISFKDSELKFLDIQEKNYNFDNIRYLIEFSVVFVVVFIFVKIYLSNRVKNAADLFVDKAMIVPRGKEVDYVKMFGHLEGHQMKLLLSSPDAVKYFNMRPVRITRNETYQTVHYAALIPIGDHYFVFKCEMDNVQDEKLPFKCEVTTYDGQVRPSSIQFTSFRDFRPIRVDYIIENNVEVNAYLPSAIFGPFIPGGNILSISTSMFFGANTYLERDSLRRFNFQEILSNYCIKLGIPRAFFYNREIGLFHSFTAPGYREVKIDEVKELLRTHSCEHQIYENIFEEGDRCFFDVARLKALTVYTIFDIRNLPNDEAYKHFFIHFIKDFCAFLFQISHTKEQGMRFRRFTDLITKSSIFSLFEISLKTNTITFVKSSHIPSNLTKFDEIYNYIVSCGDPNIKEKIDDIIDMTKTVGKLCRVSLEIRGKNHLWFDVSTYTTNDPVTGELICSIITKDITKQKKQDMDLEDSIEDLEFTVEALGLSKFVVVDDKLIDVDNKLAALLGRNESNLNIVDIVHPNDVKNLNNIGNGMVTLRLQKGDGEYMWFSLFANKEIGFSFNVDEAVKTREKLQMTGKGLQLASVSSSLIFWTFDLETGVVSSLLQQPTIWEVLSVDPRAKFDKFIDFVAKEEIPIVSKAIKDIKDGVITQWTGECRIMRNGYYEWHRVIFALANQNSVHCFAASVNRQKETAKKLADNCKIRDIIFSSGKLTVWKYFDDDLPVTDQKRLVPGIPTVVRVNKTFVNQCMQPEFAEVFMEKINQAIETGESVEFKVCENDKYYSIKGRYQQTTKQVVGICVDVTDVEKANKELEEQKAIAVDANRQKTDFLANMSHEIRTPMNPIFGLLDLIAQSEITDEQRLLVDTMRSLSFQLLKLLDDTLNLSKIEHGDMQMNISSVDFWSAIEPDIVASASIARKNGIKFIVKSFPPCPLKIMTDPHLIHQVLSNIFSNSLKFTKSGSIEVSVEWEDAQDKEDPESKETMKITISDTGIGISHEQQKVIFERFVQADPSVPRSYGGTGLGLSLVQEIVRFMGGTLTLKSDLGKGTTFFIEIPVTSTKFPDVANFKDNNDRYIIIMSKDPLTKDMIKQWAEILHFKTKFAINVAEAVKATQELIVSGIVIDRPAEVVKKLVSKCQVPICALIEAEESSKAEFRLTRPLLPHQLCGFFNFCRYGMKTRVVAVPQKIEKTTKKVLVVEDNKQNQFVMKKILQKIGCTFDMAENGQIAIDILDKNINEPFDLIFMDCQMPVLDGLSATRIIRASDKPYKNIRIIALTANAVEGDKERCLSAGMDYYLSKPVRLQQITDALVMFD